MHSTQSWSATLVCRFVAEVLGRTMDMNDDAAYQHALQDFVEEQRPWMPPVTGPLRSHALIFSRLELDPHAGHGSVSKVEVAILHRPSKGISIHEQADDEVVHLYRLGEADGLANQAFDAGPKRQVLALDFLRIAIAGGVLCRVKMTRVRPPLIGIVVGQAERFQKSFELEE